MGTIVVIFKPVPWQEFGTRSYYYY